MLHNRNPKDVSFAGVAMFVIITGSAIFALGLVQWGIHLFEGIMFGYPILKIIGGMGVFTLGYILLELELMRHNK